MFKSESIVKISAALLRAQKNIGGAQKGVTNTFFKAKYADLGSVMQACKEALNDQGITVLQPVTRTADNKHAVETVLLHESGEFIVSVMVLELDKTTMQNLGSAISYARRYSLQSLVFIPAEDDDAESTMGRNKTNTDDKPRKSSFKPSTAPETKKADETPKEETKIAPKANGSGKTTSVEDNW